MGKVLAIILGIIVGFALLGLIFWGIGALIIWAFSISFTWDYWHGLSTAFIVWILSSIFNNRNN